MLSLYAFLLFTQPDRIELAVDRKTGRFDLVWPGRAAVRGAWGEVRFADGERRKTTDYPQHEVSRNATGVTIRHRGGGKPELRQVFTLDKGRGEATVRIDALGSTGANYMAPVVTESPVDFKHRSALQSLFVPYDNDMYFRYRSDGWGEGEGDGDGSYEVGAVYDDGTRNGLVAGSIDHDVWKSAVRFKRNAKGEVAGLRVYAGVTSKYTHDSQPHGTVTGSEVRSPRMVLGWYDDWRSGLERYGDLNAKVKPPLAWPGRVPFGWNSWSGHKSKIQADSARAATDFVAGDSVFRSGGTAYVNLDSFWDNLTRAQRKEFVDHAHALGLKAGIYFTPFTGWGKTTDRLREAPYTVGEITIKDDKGEPLPKLDGGWPLDPTHPGTLARIDRQLAEFVELGFDYVKLDFLSHGALEGKHYDPKVETGTQAYAVGMRRIVKDLSARPIFISLSIAPMFPQGYAHSRRISCDVFANIGATEYLLNSATYGWWTAGRIYAFNDPDSACVYQPKDEPPVSEAESRSRFTASVVAGGMMMAGDDMTKPEAVARVRAIFSNHELLDVARSGQPFRPVSGDTATRAGDTFVRAEPSGKLAYVAVFNYDKAQPLRKTISLARMGLVGKGDWQVHEFWAKTESTCKDSLTVNLGPADCAIFRLKIRR